MTLLHIVPNVRNRASGWSYSVPRLCESLATRGHEVELSCIAARPDIVGVRTTDYPALPIFKKHGISLGHTRALRSRAKQVDVVHNHSLWSMMNVLAGWVVPRQRAKLIVSPRGTLALAALHRRRRLKHLLWPLQYRTLAHADLLHATSDAEYQDIRSAGLINPVAIVPNGIDVPPLPPRESHKTRTLLFLSRIHPQKGLGRLLQCWKQLQDRHPRWQLIIAGKGEKRYEGQVREMAGAFGLHRVKFIGPVYGVAKSRLFARADLFALPTDSENFGVVIAEALAHACPCVVSTGTPWSRLQTEGCGWWVDADVSTFASALDGAMSLPQSAREEMGARGRAWMARDYGWDAVAQQIDMAYQWVLGSGDRPTCIRTT